MDDKINKAISISYDDNKSSPTISAKGEGAYADAIVDMAKELGIYIHKDKRLLDELSSLKEGESVPEQLFDIIATILAFSYVLQGKTPDSWNRTDGTRAINTKV